MDRDEVRQSIREIAIIPAVRLSSEEDAHFAVEAVSSGGIPIVEITMTVPGALDLISHITRHHRKTIVGAGTVLDVDTAHHCIDAGASFITAPELYLPVVEFAAKQNVAVIPGALTPTEVTASWRAGADFVKVFPCEQVGGEKYIKAIHTSLPQIPLIAAGGVKQQTAGNFILSGATAIGIGTELIPLDAVRLRQKERIRELARRFAGFVAEARRQLAAVKAGEAGNPPATK
jgi:2-dehydro-3-deoxyphosphogluconate aldolase/(4S)-4-hydroxy-2-oxoglutarate aldolase